MYCLEPTDFDVLFSFLILIVIMTATVIMLLALLIAETWYKCLHSYQHLRNVELMHLKTIVYALLINFT